MKEQTNTQRINVNEKLRIAKDAIKAIRECGYWPYASPAPCSTEVTIKRELDAAQRHLQAAIAAHESMFGSIRKDPDDQEQSEDFRRGWWTCIDDASGFLSPMDLAGLLEDKGMRAEDVKEAIQKNWLQYATQAAKLYLTQIALQSFK